MMSPHHRAEKDDLASASQKESDGLAPAPQRGEGWDLPDTAERRGMVSSRHRRAERDWIAQAPQSREGWNPVEQRGMVSPRHRRAESDFGFNCCTCMITNLSSYALNINI